MTFDRDHWLDQLSRWSDLATFASLVQQCDEAIGRFGAMIQHGTGFWRDAWIASQFSQQTEAAFVRLLHPEPHPDFAVEFEGVERWFEATEAMPPSRRRGDEYREDLAREARGESTARMHSPEEWLTGNRAFEMLKTASERKASKGYASSCGLVIYLNDSDYGSDEENILRSFEPATASAGQTFQSVYVLWSSRCFLVWVQGNANLTNLLGQA